MGTDKIVRYVYDETITDSLTNVNGKKGSDQK
jgi:hypothetical protein